MLLHGRRDGLRRRVRGRERGRHVHDQDRVVARVFEQRIQRAGIARGVGIARDVDRIGTRPDRRQHGIEAFHRGGRELGERAAEIGKPVDREHADAAAIGQDRQTPARKRPHHPERLGRGEQLVEIEHAQQPGAPERRVVDGVRTGERAGMGLRRLGALRMAARLDHHHRLDPRGGARRRHEFARVADRLDVEQNCARSAVEREEVEQVAEIDVDLVAERDDRRKADLARRRPFDQARRDGARLRDQRDIAGRRRVRGEARIELGARRQHAEAIGTDEPQAGGARRLLGGFGQRPRTMAQPRGDDDGGGRASCAGLGDDAGHRLRRRGDHDDVGRDRQRLDGLDRFHALDLVVVRIDEMDRAFEAGAAQVGEHGPARGRQARTRADDRHRFRREKLVEPIG